MNAPTGFDTLQTDGKLQSIIKIAVLAVGGQGGGVLTGWIEAVGRAQGYAVQATSVAGVAQRTGATIYYIEMAPMGDKLPVFSLAPGSGDVDIMIAAEMMEAGRAIMRGFVTPGRTTLIASTHRNLAVSEKMAPGDEIASSEEVYAAAEIAADQLIMFDMDRLAVENGSVISAALFGALAGSGALPFARAAFEEAIRESGTGVDASLRTFAAGFERSQSNEQNQGAEVSAPKSTPVAIAPERLLHKWQHLETEAMALSCSTMALHGLRKTVGFQDIAYGREYLDRIKPFALQDRGDVLLANAAAKHIANAMCYDDIIRVADLKTRKARFERIDAEMQSAGNPVHLTEFFHPRGEEIISLMPAGLGVWIENRPKLSAWIDRRLNRGRRVRTHKISSFLLLYFIGGLRNTRRMSLRHKIEQAHLEEWLALCRDTLPRNYDCAVELLLCRRLIKGYSDTHARSLSKFARVINTAPLLMEREDGAQWISRLRDSALQDENGDELDGAIRTVMSFAE